MPGISQCPECNQQISLPRQTHPETRVQCPICNAEYALRLALDLAPPALIVVQEVQSSVMSDCVFVSLLAA